ncbi:MAG: hypothetical protein QXX41_10345 [Nitrososphaerota archaeon]
MRITPGKIIKVTTISNVLGYTWLDVNATLGQGLRQSIMGSATIEIPAGEIWRSFGAFFSTSYNTYPISLSVTLIINQDNVLYGYTGGTVTFPAYIPLPGVLWVPFSELIIVPGTYTVDYRYQVVYSRKDNMSFSSRIIFERLKA